MPLWIGINTFRQESVSIILKGKVLTILWAHLPSQCRIPVEVYSVEGERYHSYHHSYLHHQVAHAKLPNMEAEPMLDSKILDFDWVVDKYSALVDTVNFDLMWDRVGFDWLEVVSLVESIAEQISGFD